MICAAKGVPRRELVSGGGSRRGRIKQISFRAAVKKSNRALHGADFLGTANRKFEGWGSPGEEAAEHVRSGRGAAPDIPASAVKKRGCKKIA